MKTNFSIEQLQNPDIRRSNDILRKCVHCGFCTATCPTYLIQGDELDSPRGRIWLIRDMLENQKRSPSKNVVQHIDQCLSCMSCMTTCPSGVDYGTLVDHARSHIEKTYKRPWKEKFMRSLIATILPNPKLFRFLLKCAPIVLPFKSFMKKIRATQNIAAMIELIPKKNIKQNTIAKYSKNQAKYSKNHECVKKVLLLEGCVQPALKPNINHATVRVLNKIGVEVIIPKKQTCCGALEWHMGKTDAARKKAARNINMWKNYENKQQTQAFISNASGCGAVVKHYPHIFADYPDIKKNAANIGKKTYDITEYIASAEINLPIKIMPNLKLAYHTPCSMCHAQKIHDQPISLLLKAGFNVEKPENTHLCCGAAGVYNILQKDLADKLKIQKINALEKLKPNVIISSNIGCITHLENATEIPVIHIIELIDWTMGGPKPFHDKKSKIIH